MLTQFLIGSANARELCYKVEWQPAFGSDEPPSPTSSNGEPNGPQANGQTPVDGHLTPPIKHGRSSSAVELANGIVTPIEQPETTPVAIVGDASSQGKLVYALSHAIHFATGKEPEVTKFGALDPTGKVCVVVSELEAPILGKLSADEFRAIQEVLTKSAGVLWVVRGAHKASNAPDLGM